MSASLLPATTARSMPAKDSTTCSTFVTAHTRSWNSKRPACGRRREIGRAVPAPPAARRTVRVAGWAVRRQRPVPLGVIAILQDDGRPRVAGAGVPRDAQGGVKWTAKARRQTPADSPFAGLLPAAPADGEYLWDGSTTSWATTSGTPRHALPRRGGTRWERPATRAWRSEAEDYRAAIAAAWKARDCRTSRQVGKRPAPLGQHETLWPTELFDRRRRPRGGLVQPRPPRVRRRFRRRHHAVARPGAG